MMKMLKIRQKLNNRVNTLKIRLKHVKMLALITTSNIKELINIIMNVLEVCICIILYYKSVIQILLHS